ncbi:hypothetical protein [Polaromonas sp. SM01]|uniref:hypothetical protein n=1 Tax=Polaromonas sp. SM01 TaxID=3085630 RepID=UPI00298118AE|nr:hypothetical protein [Polaromonas sp. SM01]MDW5441801.1 hypothetical protein [Polaromonas sp. SM01]
MNYSVQLMDKKKFPEEQRCAIEQRYSHALAQHLGGPEQVLPAHRAWVNAKTRQDETPGADISLGEKKAIQHWEHAEVAARLLAFEGYTGALEDLYIEVKPCP